MANNITSVPHNEGDTGEPIHVLVRPTPPTVLATLIVGFRRVTRHTGKKERDPITATGSSSECRLRANLDRTYELSEHH
jgi:hypothetical protein